MTFTWLHHPNMVIHGYMHLLSPLKNLHNHDETRLHCEPKRQKLGRVLEQRVWSLLQPLTRLTPARKLNVYSDSRRAPRSIGWMDAGVLCTWTGMRVSSAVRSRCDPCTLPPAFVIINQITRAFQHTRFLHSEITITLLHVQYFGPQSHQLQKKDPHIRMRPKYPQRLFKHL